MSNALITGGGNRELTGDVTRPQQSIGSTAESSRTLAEVQGALTIAAARPRNIRDSVDRIMTTCQRARMAETATYQYVKGGQSISGPTIRLMEAIANSWGNVTFGFRELSQSHSESTIEAYAWDLETNVKRAVTFVVPHRMKTGQKYKTLEDPREIYEHIANQAQRRVRSCLENIIPRDIVDDAVDQCGETLKANIKVTPETIKKMLGVFEEEYKVTKDQIEQRIQRRIDAITPGQMVQMRRIIQSLRDGMSQPEEWFKPVEKEESGKKITSKGTAGAKEKLKSKTSKKEAEKPAEQQTELIDDGEQGAMDWSGLIANVDSEVDLDDLVQTISDDPDLEQGRKKELLALCETQRKEMKPPY